MSSEATAPPEELGITSSGSLGIRWPGREPGGTSTVISAELLRVYSPSAEVRGHDGVQRLVRDKADVRIDKLELIGHYGLKIAFDDGHDSGIYTWEYLDDLCRRREQLERDYRERLQGAGDGGQ